MRQFLVAATVRVDSEEGLVVHACSMHSKGSSLQYLHPPSHPVLSRIALIHDERLSVVAPSISWITNIKSNFASHTYQLLRSVGSYSGMSTVQLRRQTRWNITSDFLYHAEGVACRFRDDIKTLICQWVREGKIVENVALGMLRYEPQMENVKSCLSHTSSIDLETCVQLTKIVEKNEKDYFNYLEALSCYSFAHVNDDFGCSPPPLNVKGTNVSWLIEAAACVSPLICRSLVKSAKYSVTLRPLFCLLRKTFIASTTSRKRISSFLVQRSQEAITTLLEQNQGKGESQVIKDCCYHLGAQILSTVCDTIQHIHLTKRKNISCSTSLQLSDETTHAIFTTTSPNNLRNQSEPPLKLVVCGINYELIAVGTKGEAPDSEPRLLVRHGGDYQKFWLLDKSSKYARKMTASPPEAVKSTLRGYWVFAIYEKSRNLEFADLKWHFLSTLTGQGVFICETHGVPLTKDFRKSSFRCRCGLASFLRCPHSQCNSCVCKRHFNEGLQQPNRRVLIDPVTMTEIGTRKRFSQISSESSNSELVSENCCSIQSNESCEPDAVTEAVSINGGETSSVVGFFFTETTMMDLLRRILR